MSSSTSENNSCSTGAVLPRKLGDSYLSIFVNRRLIDHDKIDRIWPDLTFLCSFIYLGCSFYIVLQCFCRPKRNQYIIVFTNHVLAKVFFLFFILSNFNLTWLDLTRLNLTFFCSFVYLEYLFYIVLDSFCKHKRNQYIIVFTNHALAKIFFFFFSIWSSMTVISSNGVTKTTTIDWRFSRFSKFCCTSSKFSTFIGSWCLWC